MEDIHFLLYPKTDQTACSYRASNRRHTEDKKEVTCPQCLSVIETLKWAK